MTSHVRGRLDQRTNSHERLSSYMHPIKTYQRIRQPTPINDRGTPAELGL